VGSYKLLYIFDVVKELGDVAKSPSHRGGLGSSGAVLDDGGQCGRDLGER